MSHQFSNSHSQQPIPVSLGKPSLRRRLEAYYTQMAPSTLANENEWLQKFDLIYRKYGGSQEKEEMLRQKLMKKYGNAIQLVVATSMDGRNPKKKQPTVQTHSIKDPPGFHMKEEDWFTITEMEANSGITDFTSNRFDPMAALYTDESTLSQTYDYIKNAPRLDNIAKARIFLADFDPQRLVKTNNSHKSKQGQKKLSENIKIKKIPMLTSLVSQFQMGPLSILYKCHTQRKRVRVMIRYIDCIRGTLTGYILAFDKHFNMILTDVDEVYSQRITKLIEQDENWSKSELEIHRRTTTLSHIATLHNTDGSQRDSTDSYQSHHQSIGRISNISCPVRQRHCPQLLVRGDNVVMVWRLEAEKSVTVDKMNPTHWNQVGTPGSMNPILPKHNHNYQNNNPQKSQRRW